MIQLYPPERVSERIVEQTVDCGRAHKFKTVHRTLKLGRFHLSRILCGAHPAGGVPGQRGKSTVRAHQMAVPGQRRTENPR